MLFGKKSRSNESLSDHLLFSQEYILKGVVNAALGQEIGSVSISITLEELPANE